jgi:hypothetical protein
MKGTCLRCGRDYGRLDTHLKNKKPCKELFLHIPRESMISNYKKHYKDFILMTNGKEIDSNKTWICEYCNKKYSHRQSLLRHKKNHNNEQNNSNQTNNINQTNIVNQTNIYNITNNIQIIINNFGNETEISYTTFAKLFNGNINNLIPEYVKEKHIEIEENRNVLIPNYKDSMIKIYKDNDWVLAHKTSILKEILNTTIKSLIKHINKTSDQYQKKYSGSEPIEKTGTFQKIVKIKENLFKIEDNLHEKNSCKQEEMKILCELVNGHAKVIETINLNE